MNLICLCVIDCYSRVSVLVGTCPTDNIDIQYPDTPLFAGNFPSIMVCVIDCYSRVSVLVGTCSPDSIDIQYPDTPLFAGYSADYIAGVLYGALASILIRHLVFCGS